MVKKIKPGFGGKPGGRSNKNGAKASKEAKYSAHKDVSVVNELMPGYGGGMPGSSVINSNMATSAMLTDATDKPERNMTALEKMDAARIGVGKKDLERLKLTTMLDYDKLARALSVTRATLINKKNDEKFNSALSERIVSLADIYSYGYEVFEDIALFNKWMFKPNRALGGTAPYEFIDNQFGREEIRNIIGRIDYGVYS